MTQSLRTAWIIYALVVIGMLTISLVTGRRATRLAGTPHYLLTRWQVFVEASVKPIDATDAAFDALFDEAGETATMTVSRPTFVLGLLDATGPVAVLGAVALSIVTLISRRRRKRVTVMEHSGRLSSKL